MHLVQTLDEVFPQDAAYFYGYPTGWDHVSRFLNTAPISAEELVAARALVCAGAMGVVVFARTVQQEVLAALEGELGTILAKKRTIIPPEIDISISGPERNRRIQDALGSQLPDRKLIMAQPYLDESFRRKFLIDPTISTWANDKANMWEFVPEEHLTPELGRAENGQAFNDMDAKQFPFPCVVKVSNSSAGDGVRICKNETDFQAVQAEFSSYDCPILVLQFIEAVKEVGPKFAILPGSGKFLRLGATKDFSSAQGDWVGSLVGENAGGEVAEQMYEVLERQVAPKLHAKGWYGVGEGGALIDAQGKFFFHDFNLRVTGDTAQTLQWNQGLFPGRSLVVFNGLAEGNLPELVDKIKPIAQRGGRDQILNVVALASYPEGTRIHGGVLMDQEETLMENIRTLEGLGIQAGLFKRMHELQQK